MGIVHVIQERVRGCRTVAFDVHAVRRMAERRVTEDEVLDALRSPDKTGLPADPPRLRVRKLTPSGRRIDVIFEEDPTQIVVISVIAQRSGQDAGREIST